MKKQKNIIILVVGIILAATGIIILKTVESPEGIMRTLPYVLLGIGSGAFGRGVGGFLNQKIVEKDPDLEKRQKIEQEDERNQMIIHSAKAKAYDQMVYLFGGYMLILTLVNTNVGIILSFCALYLLVIGIEVYYQIKMSKSM